MFVENLWYLTTDAFSSLLLASRGLAVCQDRLAFFFDRLGVPLAHGCRVEGY